MRQAGVPEKCPLNQRKVQNMKQTKKVCKHKKAYMTAYGKYYCPGCDEMLKNI